MRIHIYTVAKARQSSHCGMMSGMISKSMPQHGHMVEADYPDVVHIWGRWNCHTIKEISRWKRRFTPVVFSSVSGLQEICRLTGSPFSHINKKKAIRSICRMADVVVAQGQEECRIIAEYGHKEALVVMNPCVTSLTTEEECGERFAKIYADLYTSHDRQAMESCEQRASRATSDAKMARLIAQTLYTDYLFRHGTCYDDNLKQLADTFIQSELADEDELARLLDQLGIKPFVRRLMGIMARRELISEGFMPVEQLIDKKARRLDEAIKSRQKP